MGTETLVQLRELPYAEACDFSDVLVAAGATAAQLALYFRTLPSGGFEPIYAHWLENREQLDEFRSYYEATIVDLVTALTAVA